MSLRTGQSTSSDPLQAVQELHRAIAQPDMALVLFFCSSRFELDELAIAINRHFGDRPVIGCTTAGEIGPAGCCEGSLSGASFSSASFVAGSAHIDGLKAVVPAQVETVTAELREQVGNGRGDSFALLLTDGLSGREESIAHSFQAALGDVPMVGASAGDDQRLVTTHVFADGAFRSDSAAFVVLRTSLPFKVFRSHHFVGGDEALVVTEADAERRIVSEINGLPAAAEYARAAGLGIADLNASLCVRTPMVVRIRGNDYVRAVGRVNADGSLQLFSAIEPGVVLHVAHSVGMTEIRRALFEELRQHVGEPSMVLGFNCIHCKLEAQIDEFHSAIETLFMDNHVIGFNSYGEQFMGIHVNQTLTGVAIGKTEVRCDA
ncbi:MAG: FIST N-terminal domain-containing protein [Azoarcus sp.]|nr:FIST N-terminal domain-containing protein [Azoarcus sp.]